MKKPCWRALLVVVLACLASACNGKKADTLPAVGTTGSTPAAISVQTNAMYVTVENRAGQPLLDVQVAIKPAGGAPYAITIPRMESGEKRELPLGVFETATRVHFDLRTTRPREVAVTAADLVGHHYDAVVPWAR